MKSVHIKKVELKNYKSIASCSIKLGKINVLVGRNGAGKSNFLDALRFVKESLEYSLDYAIKTRGGVDNVRRRSTGHPYNFQIGLEVRLPSSREVKYGFEISVAKRGVFFVKKESLQIFNAKGERCVFYKVENGQVVGATFDTMPPVSRDRLYLTNAAGLPEFRPVYEALLQIGLYNLNPESIRGLQEPDMGSLLNRDGGNIASVIERMQRECPSAIERVNSYLQVIVPDLEGVRRISLGPKETIEFKQAVEGADHPWRFHAANMSDGTLRALGCLVAISQLSMDDIPVRMVGIEEPETALHPAATGSLIDAIRECAEQTQVLITTHSADLLDHIDPSEDRLFVVQSRKGTTEIGSVDQASQKAIRDHLFTPGDLLRMDQLDLDPSSLKPQNTFSF